MRRMLLAVLSGLVMVLSLPLGAGAGPVVSADLTDAVVGPPANPGDTIEYTVDIGNTGDADAEALSFTITLDTNTDLVGGSVKVTPLAIDDTYTLSRTGTVGAGMIVIDAANGLLVNDLGGAGTTIASCAGETCTVTDETIATSMGGMVDIDPDGTFTYFPPPGFGGAMTDTFVYTLTDADGLTDTGTASIFIAEGVWYVDTAGPSCPGTGTLADPFCQITELDIAGGGANTQPGDIIFVFEGTYDAGTDIALESGQMVIGEPAGLMVVFDGGSPVVLVPAAGARPVITNTFGDAFVLVDDNSITQVSVGEVGANAVDGAGISGGSDLGTVTLTNVSIVADNGPAIDLTGDATDDVLAVSLISITADGGSSGEDGISLSAFSSGSFDVSGTTSIGGTTSPDGDGIVLSSNGAATFSFAGLDITNDSGAGGDGLLASNSGTVTVTGATNTITSTNGIAVSITDTTIGASGVTFQSVSASNAINGIVLATTGTSGGSFTVTGVSTTDGTGGTIQDSGSTMVAGIDISNAQKISLSNMNLTNANKVDGGAGGSCDGATFSGCNAAIKLDTVTDIEIVNLALDGSAEHGIFGTDVTDFDLSDSLIQNAGNAVNEHGIFFDGLFGTTAAGTASSISNTTITLSENHNVFIRNDAATNAFGGGDPDLLVVSGGTTISDLLTSNGANGLLHEAVGAANMSLDISNTTFEDNRGIGLNLQATQGGHNDLSLTGSTFNSTTATTPGQDQGMILAASQTSAITFDISTGNTFDTSDQSAIGVTGFDTASFIGHIDNNTLNPGGGSTTAGAGDGIRVVLTGGSTGVMDIDNNTINSSAFGSGMTLITRQGNGSLDVTVSNNTITANGSGFSDDGISAEAGNSSGGETNRLCINYVNNTSAGGGGKDGYQLTQSGNGVDTVFQIQGLNVTGTNEALVEGFVAGVNTSGSVDVESAVAGFIIVDYTAANCATP